MTLHTQRIKTLPSNRSFTTHSIFHRKIFFYAIFQTMIYLRNEVAPKVLTTKKKMGLYFDLRNTLTKFYPKILTLRASNPGAKNPQGLLLGMIFLRVKFGYFCRISQIHKSNKKRTTFISSNISSMKIDIFPRFSLFCR
jgi:hypothetical protein